MGGGRRRQELQEGRPKVHSGTMSGIPTSSIEGTTTSASASDAKVQMGSSAQGINDLELEILLRGNLLTQQQQRIAILESTLQETCTEIENVKGSIAEETERSVKSMATGSKPKSQSRYWTAEEHQQFLAGLEKFGTRDVKAIAQFVGTRNATQVRTHAQKYFLRMSREEKMDMKGSNPNKDDGEGDDDDGVDESPKEVGSMFPSQTRKREESDDAGVKPSKLSKGLGEESSFLADVQAEQYKAEHLQHVHATPFV